MHVQKLNLQLIKYMWVHVYTFFKFEIRAEIAGIEQFLNQIGVI